MRPAELHPRSAEKTARPRIFRHFVPSRALHSLATLVRLSLLDLPPENSMKCCPPPACPHAPHGRCRSDERGLAMVSVYSLWKTDNFTGQEHIDIKNGLKIVYIIAY